MFLCGVKQLNLKDMEIVTIEKKVYEKMLEDFKIIAERVDRINSKWRDKSLKGWLDHQDVCDILNISKRTLQSYRDSGKIGYSQIGYKIFYRAKDIKKLLKDERNNNNAR